MVQEREGGAVTKAGGLVLAGSLSKVSKAMEGKLGYKVLRWQETSVSRNIDLGGPSVVGQNRRKQIPKE